MKRLIFLLFSLISFSAFSQSGSLSQSVYRSRVNDSTTVNGATAQGYGYFFWNNQKAVPSWQFWNGTSLVDWDPAAAGGGGAVSSVFSRTGAVTAQSGDYTATQITNTPAGTIAATTAQAAINELDTEKASKLMAPNTQTTNYTLVLTDADVKAVEMNSVSSTNVTVPPNSSVAFPVGTLITVVQKNTGDVTIVAGSGVTITPPAGGNLLSPGQGQPMQLWQRATDDWYLWNGGEPIVPSALTKTDDTNVTLTLGGDPTNALLQATSLTLGWTGTLAASRGGTGGTAGAWPLTGTGTLTGATTIAGTSTNTIKYSIPSLGTTVTDGAGLHLQNATAAAAGAQQISPILTFEGNGWKTNATAASQVVNWRQYVLPVQGAASPTANLLFQSNVNGSTTGGALTLASDGAKLVTQANGLQILTNSSTFGGLTFTAQAAASNSINFANTGFVLSNAATVTTAIDEVTLNPGTGTATSGTTNAFRLTANFNPTSGTGAFNWFHMNSAQGITQTGGANGNVKVFDIGPTYTSAGGNVYFAHYHPTVTSISGSHYGVVVEPTAALSGFGLASPTATLHVVGTTKLDGSVTLPTAGNGILIKEGSNATMGVATLSAGAVTVNTTKVTANSRILLTVQSLGTVAVPMAIGVTARSAGTSFTITSADGTDTSVVAWVIIEPAP